VTAAFTLTPLWVPLTRVLEAAFLAAGTWATCLLVALFCGRQDLTGKVAGWQAVAVALLSAVLFSTGNWQFGGLLAVLAWAAGVHWRRTRNGKREKGELV